MKKLVSFSAAVLAMVSLGTVAAEAKEEKLTCTLYMGSSMDSAAQSLVTVKDSAVTLMAVRRTGVCVFADGSVADKQFVMSLRADGDGSKGSGIGYSVYTMQKGGSITASWSYNWGATGAKGTYQILGGTGNYKGATGNGTIDAKGAKVGLSEIANIVLNVKTP